MSPAVLDRTRTRPHAGLVPALLLLLAGLFAMHGLSGHGCEAGPPGPMGSMAAAVHDPAPTTTSHVAHAGPADAMTVVSAPALPGPDHGGLTMAGVCLAVLGGLVLALSSGRRTPLRIPVPALLAVPAAGRTGRDRDPPSLTALSVRRC